MNITPRCAANYRYAPRRHSNLNLSTRPKPVIAETRLNHFLNVLPPMDYAQIREHLQPVHFSSGQTIYNVDDNLDFVYFPETCVASRVALMEDGATVEVGLLGAESIIGVMTYLGAECARHWTVTEVAGRAARMRATDFKNLVRQNPNMQQPVLNYCRLMYSQISQRSVCRGRHAILEQLSGWLLMMQDRAKTNQLPLTQESIARRLGVRRAGITVAANDLKRKGLIEYSRGHINIINRPELEKVACECYSTSRNDYDGYLSMAKHN